MSYLQPIYCNFNFNVTEAKQKLKSIIKVNNITDLYHLGIQISADQPTFINTTEKFIRFFSKTGSMMYILFATSIERNSSLFMTHGNLGEIYQFDLRIIARSYSNYEYTQFNEQFIKHFNYSLSYGYANYFKQIKNTKHFEKRNHLSSIPFLLDIHVAMDIISLLFHDLITSFILKELL